MRTDLPAGLFLFAAHAEAVSRMADKHSHTHARTRSLTLKKK